MTWNILKLTIIINVCTVTEWIKKCLDTTKSQRKEVWFTKYNYWKEIEEKNEGIENVKLVGLLLFI